MNKTSTYATIIALICVVAGCGGSGPGHTDRTSPPHGPAHLDPSTFVAAVDHPYFPLTPGMVWKYQVTSSDGPEKDVVTVLDRTKVVDGVTATVVHDLVTRPDGKKVLEDTYDWYAQDASGAVWYLGEATKAYSGGKVSTKGSWQAGVDGARAGLLMVADPKVGKAYEQEYYRGEAEDRGKVLSVDEQVTGPTGHYDHVVRTADTTPLEPNLVENKWYARGVGVVKEAEIKGGDERVILVRFTRP
jgi:hypothetical protein